MIAKPNLKEKPPKRKRSKRGKPSTDTLALLFVVPFITGVLLCAYGEYVPAHTDTMRRVGGWLAILGVCFFFGSNGIVLLWGLVPRFGDALKEKDWLGKAGYFALLLAGLVFVYGCISLLWALWHSAMRS